MKIKSGFRLRTIANENVIMGEGIENIDFSKIISMNRLLSFGERLKIAESSPLTIWHVGSAQSTRLTRKQPAAMPRNWPVNG